MKDIYTHLRNAGFDVKFYGDRVLVHLNRPLTTNEVKMALGDYEPLCKVIRHDYNIVCVVKA